MTETGESGYSNASFAARLRRHVIDMTSRSGASHIASCFSIADIMAVLFNSWLRLDSRNPRWGERDRFILSKGHAAAILYASLAELGFIDRACLKSYYTNGSNLMGHASHKVPGVELSTGSLGHGLPVATGMAYAGKVDQKKHRVVALMSDGECDEGSNWEAAMFAGHHKLENLRAIIDYNKIQSLKSTTETLDLEPFSDKWRAFGWQVREVDGHCYRDIESALNSEGEEGRPRCLIMHTRKGKGVSFMENSVLWHYRSPQGDEYRAAVAELERQTDA